MIPLLFGPQDHRKYGVFQAAVGHGSKGRGIVIVDALFDEALCAHRALRHASGAMAEKRWSSLRFDYFGTGDSAGETGDFSLAQALDDTADAIEELKSCAGLDEVYLLGLRLGGALALLTANARQDVRGVVLWDPIIEGQQVLARYGAAKGEDKNTEPVEGFSLSNALQTELRNLSIREALTACDKPLLMVCSAPTSGHRQLAAEHPQLDYREIDAPEAWSNTAIGGVRPIPTAVINEIRTWKG